MTAVAQQTPGPSVVYHDDLSQSLTLYAHGQSRKSFIEQTRPADATEHSFTDFCSCLLTNSKSMQKAHNCAHVPGRLETKHCRFSLVPIWTERRSSRAQATEHYDTLVLLAIPRHLADWPKRRYS